MADLHFGQLSDSFVEKNGLERSVNETVKQLNNILKYAIKNEIKIIFIAGDIFENQNPIARYNKMFNVWLKKTYKAKIEVIIIPGNHDGNNSGESAICPIKEANFPNVRVYEEITSEVIVMSIGIEPEIGIAKNADLKIGKTGAIKVDPNFLTNDPDIYAVGDAIEVYNTLTQDNFKLSLAGPAQKQARSVADHIHGKAINNTGYIGSSVVKIFNYYAAATGLNEQALASLNIDYDWVQIIPKDKVGIMPDAEELSFKLIFEKPTGRVLGAQAIGRGNVDKRVDVIATAIKFGATIDNLRDLELCYAPPFGTAKDAINYAGYVASNLLHGSFKQVSMSKVRELVEQDAYILDVRELDEYEAGHINKAIIIPLSQLRDRYEEIPKDVPVYIHCRSGQRSYNAVLALQTKGYTQVFNISGGFIGICAYEYFTDKVKARKPIVTEYNLR